MLFTRRCDFFSRRLAIPRDRRLRHTVNDWNSEAGVCSAASPTLAVAFGLELSDERSLGRRPARMSLRTGLVTREDHVNKEPFKDPSKGILHVLASKPARDRGRRPRHSP